MTKKCLFSFVCGFSVFWAISYTSYLAGFSMEEPDVSIEIVNKSGHEIKNLQLGHDSGSDVIDKLANDEKAIFYKKIATNADGFSLSFVDVSSRRHYEVLGYYEKGYLFSILQYTIHRDFHVTETGLRKKVGLSL